MPKYFCDYCDVYLTHDSMSVRKAHNSGRNHIRNVVDYYQQIGHEQAQLAIDSITQDSDGKPTGLPPAGFPGSTPGGGSGAPPPFAFPNMPGMPPGMPAFPPGMSLPPGMPLPPFMQQGQAGSPGGMSPFMPPMGPNGMPFSPPPGGMPGFPPPGMPAGMTPGPSGSPGPGTSGPPGQFAPPPPGIPGGPSPGPPGQGIAQSSDPRLQR